MFHDTARLRKVAATGLLSEALLGGVTGMAFADVPQDPHSVLLGPGAEYEMPTWWLGGTDVCTKNLGAGPAQVEIFAGFTHWNHTWNAGDNSEQCWRTSYFGAHADVVNRSDAPGTDLEVYEPSGPSGYTGHA